MSRVAWFTSPHDFTIRGAIYASLTSHRQYRGFCFDGGQPALADGHSGEHASDAAPTIAAPEIEYTEWMLDNGLRVIAIEDDTTSTVTTSMWYDIGSKLDPEGRHGFAHLFEHILQPQDREYAV